MVRKIAIKVSLVVLFIVVPVLASPVARAEAVTVWNRTAGDIIVDAGLGPLPADGALAMIQAAVYEAVNAITRRGDAPAAVS